MIERRKLLAAATAAVALTLTACVGPPIPSKPRPTTAPTVIPIERAKVLAIGDSVMDGGRSALLSTIPGIVVDARGYRQLAAAIPIVQGHLDAKRLPSTVIIHLGTNGVVRAADCDTLMRLLRGRTVLMLTIQAPQPYETAVNNMLKACATRNGVRLVDFKAELGWRRELFYNDGVHLRPAGQTTYAGYLADALDAAWAKLPPPTTVPKTPPTTPPTTPPATPPPTTSAATGP